MFQNKLFAAPAKKVPTPKPAPVVSKPQPSPSPVLAVTPVDDLFGDAIYSYSRRQAIEDGLFVQLSGPGYIGDAWIPKMVREAGFTCAVCMTTTSFNDCVMPVEPNSDVLAPCQDVKGRLWDVLYMGRLAVAKRWGKGSQVPQPGDKVNYQLGVVPNIPEGSDRHPRPKITTLCIGFTADDDGSAAITIMYPHED